MAAKVKINLLKVGQNTIKEFGDDDMATTSGALTYFTFLALFPLIILVITIASFFFDSPEGRQNLTNLMAGAFSGSDINKLVNDAVNNAVKDRGGASIFSLVGLIFSASGIFGTLSSALKKAFEAKPTSQNFILNYLINIASLAIAGILIIAVNLATILLTTIAGGAKVINFYGVQLPDWGFYLINIAISVLALWGVFILMYKYLPRIHIEFKDVFLGSLIGAIGWTLLKELFGFYLAHFGPKASTYGSLSTVVALLLYIYIASIILLMGAEFCSEYSKLRKKNEVAATAGVATADQPAPDRAKDPRYAVHQRLASELDAVKSRLQAREQVAAAPAQAAIVGAPAPEPTRPIEDPLTKAAPVVATAAGAAVVAGVVASVVQGRK